MDTHRVTSAHWTLVVALFCLTLADTNARAASPVASVDKIDGKAYVSQTGGSTRRLSLNDKLYEQERVITAKNTEVDIKFTDGTELSLGSSTIVKIDSYAYKLAAQAQADEAAEESFSLSIVKGAVRAFTGLLAKRRPRSVRFTTAVATIGIRGTHFAAEVEGDSATIILLAQQDADASNAIEVSNTYGKVEIDKAGWGTEIPDATSPPSPPREMRSTHSMTRILRSIQTNRRVIAPRMPMH